MSSAEPDQPADPYATIACRNMFDLKPILPITSPPAPAPTIAKITPRGITTILGGPVVLFEATDCSDGIRSARSYYALGEGQCQDRFKIIRIDMQTGTVIFDNHGTVQQIPLSVSPATGMDFNPRPPTPPINAERPFAG